jgi:RNA polymerase sigma-70 factor, ECF subfamily
MSQSFFLTFPAPPSTSNEVRAVSDASPSAAPDVTVLVDRARRRDPAAFRELFHSYLGLVHRVVRRLAGPGPDVEDFVQSAFVEAFRSLPDFRGDALFSTWLTRITVRVTMHGTRRRPPRALTLEESAEHAELANEDPNPERIAAAREEIRFLEGLLAEMRPKRRAAFVLHVLEGHPMEEVAAILNASVSAVKVRVHDARRHIERRCNRRPEMAAWLGTGGQP